MFVSRGKHEQIKTIHGLERDKRLVVKFRERTGEKTIRAALDLPAIDQRIEQAMSLSRAEKINSNDETSRRFIGGS